MTQPPILEHIDRAALLLRAASGSSGQARKAQAEVRRRLHADLARAKGAAS